MGGDQPSWNRLSGCQVKNPHLNNLVVEKRTNSPDNLELIPGVFEMIDLVGWELSPCQSLANERNGSRISSPTGGGRFLSPREQTWDNSVAPDLP